MHSPPARPLSLQDKEQESWPKEAQVTSRLALECEGRATESEKLWGLVCTHLPSTTARAHSRERSATLMSEMGGEKEDWPLDVGM